MASGRQAYFDSLKQEDLADIVSYLCPLPHIDDQPITRRLVKQQRRCVLEKIISDFIRDPQKTRASTSKAGSVMVKESNKDQYPRNK